MQAALSIVDQREDGGERIEDCVRPVLDLVGPVNRGDTARALAKARVGVVGRRSSADSGRAGSAEADVEGAPDMSHLGDA